MPEEIKERYLEIRTVPDQQVLSVIEILSPTNKLTRDGREQYERKRFKVLGSSTNLVEIDLVRVGFIVKYTHQFDILRWRSSLERLPDRCRRHLGPVLDDLPPRLDGFFHR